MNVSKHITALYSCLILSILACYSQKSSPIGSVFVYPHSEEGLDKVRGAICDATGKVFVLIPYTGCKCELTSLNKWRKIIQMEGFIDGGLPLYIIIHSAGEDIDNDMIISQLIAAGYNFNYVIDTDLAIIRDNNIPYSTTRNTYVVDKHDVIRYVGNPTIRRKELAKFLGIIKKIK